MRLQVAAEPIRGPKQRRELDNAAVFQSAAGGRQDQDDTRGERRRLPLRVLHGRLRVQKILRVRLRLQRWVLSCSQYSLCFKLQDYLFNRLRKTRLHVRPAAAAEDSFFLSFFL